MQAVAYSSTRRPGAGAIAALLAGALYIVQAIMDQVWPQAEFFATFSDYLMEIVFIAALAATLAGLAALHLRRGMPSSRAETLGFRMAAVGVSGTLVSACATLLVGHDALGPIFLLGLLGTFVGQIIFGIALVRLRRLPGWLGAALILGLPVSVALDAFGGGVLLGLTWLALSYHLHTTAMLPAESGLTRA